MVYNKGYMMGFREIAMIVVALILGGILALNVAPSISASGDATKASMLNSEFESIASASKMWMANNSTTGNFTGINAEEVSDTIPNLVLSGTGATSSLTSKLTGDISYSIASGTSSSTDDSVVLTVNGLDNINKAEASVKNALVAKYGASNVTDTDAADGILVVKVRG